MSLMRLLYEMCEKKSVFTGGMNALQLLLIQNQLN